MEDPVYQGAFHEADHAGPHDRVGVDTVLFVTLHVVEAEAVETFHHQHPAGDEFRVRTRHHKLALIEIGEHRCDIDHVGGFDPKVELLADRAGEHLDQRRRVGERRHRDTPDEER